MTVEVLIRSFAEREIEDAFGWYLEAAPEYAGAFLDELSATIRRIGESPLIYRPVHGEVRRAALPRYPYFGWFTLVAGRAQVIAVSHKREDPQTARSRVYSRS